MKRFVGNIATNKIPFMGDEIEIRKLSAGAVKRISAASKDQSEENTMEVLVAVIKEGVVLEEGEVIDAALLEEFPLDELNTLSTAIMEFAGITAAPAAEGNAA